MRWIDRGGWVLGGLLLIGFSAPDPAFCDSERWVLDNGLTVILGARPDDSLISVDMQYLTGSGSDPHGKEGLAHLTEHLMFTSAAGYESGGLRSGLTLYATQYNARTGPFRTYYMTKCLPSLLDNILDIEAARMAALSPTPDEFIRESSIVQHERGFRHHTNPEDHLLDAMFVAGFPGHPLGREPSAESIAGITAEDVREFHDQHYNPNRAVLWVRGDIDFGEVGEAIRTRFNPIQPSDGTPEDPWDESLPPPRRAEAIVDDFDQRGFLVATLYRLPYQQPEDVAKAELLRSFLDSEGLGTGLWSIRNEALVGLFVRGTYSQNASEGPESINANRDVQWYRQSLRKYVKSARRSLARNDRFVQIQEAASNSVRRSLNNPSSHLSIKADNANRDSTGSWAETLLKSIENATVQETQSSIRTLLDAKTSVRGVLHGRDSDRRVDAQLVGSAASPDSVIETPYALAEINVEQLRDILRKYELAPGISLQLSRLSNGSQLAYVEIPGSAMTVITQTQLFPYLSEESPGKRPGISTFFRLLAKAGYAETGHGGASQRTADPLPFDMSLSVTPCEVSIGGTAPIAESEKLLDAVARRIASDSFNLRRWRNILEFGAANMARSQEDPRQAAKNYLSLAVFGDDHPYSARFVNPTRTLRKLKYNDMERLHRKLRRVGERTWIGSGSIPATQFHDLAEARLSKLSFSAEFAPALVPPRPDGVRGQVFPAFDRSEVTLEVAFPVRAIGPANIRWAEMELLLSCLEDVVEGALRHQKGLVYYVTPTLEIARGVASVHLHTQSLPGRSLAVHRQLSVILERVQRDGFSDLEILRSRVRLTASLRSKFSESESAVNPLRTMARFRDLVNEPIAAVLAVDPGRLNEIARQVVDSGNYVFALTGPILEEEIEQFGVTASN
jgi:predicted Zn-dependent peptidase